LRAGGAKRVTTLLSGGLDSRVVVALLASEGYEVNALNYAKQGIQDEVYARAFAHAASVQYFSCPRRDGEMGQFHIARRRIAQEGIISDLPDVVWTGQAAGTLIAGSANERIIGALRSGDFLMAAREHCAAAHHTLPARLFRHSSSELEERVIGAIAEEMEHYETADRGHSFMLFRLFNRVRHGADISYEGILEHRLDQYSPFVDETALRITLGLDPIELLRHKFYHEWLAVLPSFISAVPWQSYPGHLTSPVKADSHLLTQWQEGGTAYAKGKRRRSQREAFKVLWQGQKELSQWGIASALALDVSRIRNCRHMLDSASAFLVP
jgi:asparagine synthase (glutamine-hydrolysing)